MSRTISLVHSRRPLSDWIKKSSWVPIIRMSCFVTKVRFMNVCNAPKSI
jgi:hypothetical protein